MTRRRGRHPLVRHKAGLHGVHIVDRLLVAFASDRRTGIGNVMTFADPAPPKRGLQQTARERWRIDCSAPWGVGAADGWWVSSAAQQHRAQPQPNRQRPLLGQEPSARRHQRSKNTAAAYFDQTAGHWKAASCWCKGRSCLVHVHVDSGVGSLARETGAQSLRERDSLISPRGGRRG